MAKSKKNKRSTSPKKIPRRPAQVILPSFLTNTRLHCIAIMLLSMLLYVNTINHDYTQDDAIVIYDNMFTTTGLAGLGGIYKYDTFYGFFKEEGKANLVTGGRYRPFTLMMYAVEVQLFAKPLKDDKGNVVKNAEGNTVYDAKGRPRESNTVKKIGHIVNILLYGLTGVVLYLLLLLLLKHKENPLFAYSIALGTALIFIAHPIHTEAVANIKGRDEIVALLGSLAAAYFIIRAHLKNQAFSIAAAICFFCALLSKENAITFIGAVPLMMYIFTKAKFSEIVLHSLTLIIPTVVFLGIRFSVLPNSGLGEASMELMNNPYLKIEGGQWVNFTLSERLATIFTTLGQYIKLLFVPHPLTHDYYPRHIEVMTWSDWKPLLSLLFHLGLLVYGFIGLLKKDILSFGILFYFGTLFIVSNLLFPVGTNMSERFLFMPSVGFCFVLAVLLYRLFKKLSKLKTPTYKAIQPMYGVAILVVLVFSTKTIVRNNAWKDNFTLFTTDIEVSKNSAKLCNAVGGELLREYSKDPNEQIKNQKIQEAVGHLENALRIHPTYKNSVLQLGNAYNYLKQYDKSIEYYQKVLAMSPGDKDAERNLGITYREAGRYYGEEKGDLQKAITYLERAVQLNPNEYEVLRLLGVAYGIGGRQDKAIDYFQRALNVNPKNADAMWNLANAYQYNGNTDQANALRQQAVSIDPEVANRNQSPR